MLASSTLNLLNLWRRALIWTPLQHTRYPNDELWELRSENSTTAPWAVGSRHVNSVVSRCTSLCVLQGHRGSVGDHEIWLLIVNNCLHVALLEVHRWWSAYVVCPSNIVIPSSFHLISSVLMAKKGWSLDRRDRHGYMWQGLCSSGCTRCEWW